MGTRPQPLLRLCVKHTPNVKFDRRWFASVRSHCEWCWLSMRKTHVPKF